ncbi:MAG: hypothetical protein R3C56_23925 [Pirellulaceae bacterium]
MVDGQRALQLKGEERPIAFTAGDVVPTVGDNARAVCQRLLDPVHPPRAISLDFISQEKTSKGLGRRGGFYTGGLPGRDQRWAATIPRRICSVETDGCGSWP